MTIKEDETLEPEVHRFRWLWNFIFIPISIGLIIFGLNTKSSLEKETKKLNAQAEHYTVKLAMIDKHMLELNAVSNKELMEANYQRVNDALLAGVQKVSDMQIKLREATNIADVKERESKVAELEKEQNKLFANGFSGNSIFLLNSDWKLEVLNTTPFATSTIPVVFTMRNDADELMGAAFATYYVQEDTFALHSVVYSTAGLESQKNPVAIGD